MDGLIEELHGYALQHAIVVAPDDRGSEPRETALVATGGYGRGVLAPFSDIDLLFVSPKPPGERARAVVEFVLYFLWDLGLKVGHATRSVEECLAEARRDVTVRTSLIDARLLSGNLATYTVFRESFLADCKAVGSASFITAKQSERDARHHRYGEFRFWSSRTSRKAREGCATCRPFTG